MVTYPRRVSFVSHCAIRPKQFTRGGKQKAHKLAHSMTRGPKKKAKTPRATRARAVDGTSEAKANKCAAPYPRSRRPHTARRRFPACSRSHTPGPLPLLRAGARLRSRPRRIAEVVVVVVDRASSSKV